LLSEIVTPEVLQPTPLKKNLVPRFGARIRKGETRFHFLVEITKGDYTASKTNTLMDLEALQLRTN
jgi:hypothetical protein